MQLKLTTDYAIRTIVYLATQSGITSVAEIGNKMGISENYLMKVLKALKDAGLVAGYQGKRGGLFVGYRRSDGRYYKSQQMSGERWILQPAWNTVLYDQKVLSGITGPDRRLFNRDHD